MISRMSLHGLTFKGALGNGRALRVFALSLLLCALCFGGLGCTTPKARADSAFEAERYEEALKMYEEIIDGGSRDPEVYVKAARASLKIGDFGGAERFYSRAIRYGGGIPVMRALAELYIQTSNYARAIQVLRELLNFDPNQQTVYNNLGTALMYAGDPFDAESYLMIAQQMDPSDPLPYLNLGLLYDQHLRQPRFGAQFYICYLQMASRAAPQRAQVAARIEEVGLNPTRSPDELTCGEVYKPSPQRTARVNLRDEFPDEDEAPPSADPRESKPVELDFTKDGEQKGDAAQEDGDAQGDDASAEESVVIQSSGGSPPPQTTPDLPAPQQKQTPRGLARALFEKQEYKAALEAMMLLDGEERDAADARFIARIHSARGEAKQAETWWRLSLEKEVDPVALGELMKLLDAQERKMDLVKLCNQYRGKEIFELVRQHCPPLEIPQVTVPPM